jgi:hypothetical protein
MSTLLIFHIFIALTSIIGTAFAVVRPSNASLYVSYILVALTLITGTHLLILHPSHLTQSCLVGLTYLVLVSLGIFSAKNRLASSTIIS